MADTFDIEALEPIQVVETPIYLHYHYIAPCTLTPFLRALKNGKLTGALSPATGKVLIPPLGACPESGTATAELLPLQDSGTVLSFTTVHLPIPDSPLKPPFTVANILLDGADQTISHLVTECDPADVVIGMRVRAHWKPREDWDFGLENIHYFVPTDEPVADVDQLRRDCLKRAEQRREGGAQHA